MISYKIIFWELWWSKYGRMCYLCFT